MSEHTPTNWLNGIPLKTDDTLPPDTIRIEAAQTHLVKITRGTAEFVGGPHDGTRLGESREPSE